MDRGGCKEVEGHLHTGAQVAHLQGKQGPLRGCLARAQELKSSDKNFEGCSYVLGGAQVHDPTRPAHAAAGCAPGTSR